MPCFIHWPGGSIKGGRDVKKITAHIDLFPTLINLCDLKQPESVRFDGISLVPLLNNRGSKWPDRIMVTDSQRVDHPIKWRRSATMTDKWRLISGEELYDMKADPGQKHNVSGKHPEIVKRLRQGYEDWWTDISKRFDDYCEIIIGSKEENPSCLSTHDIHGQVMWDQSQIRKGRPTDGFWAIEVARDGTYEIALRRWPKEANLPITDPVPAQKLEPDRKKLSATHARLKIADVDETKLIPKGAVDVKFKVRLDVGKTRLQAWFINGIGNGVTFGAYYVYVTYLS